MSMRTKHQFRPAGQWALEDRIALSHASVVAEVAAPTQGLRATFKGRYLAVPPAAIGGPTVANLAGSTQVSGLGMARLNGTLTANPSLPPTFSNTQGITFLASRRAGGTVTSFV